MPTRSALDAPLPARWGLVQRHKNTVIYALVRAGFWVLSHLPLGLVTSFAKALGALGWALDFPHRRLAENNLGLAMPELTKRERRKIARRMFLHLARSAAEATHIETFLEGPRAVRLSPETCALIDRALAKGKGVVAVSGHIGNWELMAQVLAHAGYPVYGIARPLYDPRLTRWVNALRTAHGMQIAWRGDSALTRTVLRVFKSNGILAMLVDQDMRVQGTLAPFFGRPAHTPTGAASLALRTGATILLGWAHRRGSTHEVHFEPCPAELTGDLESDVLRVTTHINTRLEAAIRQAPEQWTWLHERWKRAP